jgi:hypothetical protein
MSANTALTRLFPQQLPATLHVYTYVVQSCRCKLQLRLLSLLNLPAPDLSPSLPPPLHRADCSLSNQILLSAKQLLSAFTPVPRQRGRSSWILMAAQLLVLLGKDPHCPLPDLDYYSY